MLTEIEDIIKSVPTIGPYHAGAKEAAHAIYAWLREGVVWEETVEIEEAPGWAYAWLYDDHRAVVGHLRRSIVAGMDGQRLCVTVSRLPKGEQADSTEQATTKNGLQAESEPLEGDKEEGDADRQRNS